jgi:hypothetical protein
MKNRVIAATFVAFALMATPAFAESPWWHLTTGSRPTYLPLPCHPALPAATGKYKDSECTEHISKKEEEKKEGAGFEQGTGQIVVNVSNLGDAPTSKTACEKVATRETGKYSDAACTEEEPAAKGEYEIEQTPVVVSDRLPEGLRATSIEANGLTCSLAKLDCVLESAAAPYSQLEMRINVVVESAAPGQVQEASVSGGGAPAVSVSHELTVSSSPTPFGLSDFQVAPEEEGGAPDTQAGSHPFQTTFTLALNQGGFTNALGLPEVLPAGFPKDLRVRLPEGLVGNPTPFKRCSLAQFFHQPSPTCPAQTALGVALITFNEASNLGLDKLPEAVYNLEPQTGEPARLGFLVTPNAPVFIDAAVRSGQDYAIESIAANITQTVGFISSEVVIWGVPGDSRHDASRGGGCLHPEGQSVCQSPLEESNPPPFFEMPTSCQGPLRSSVHGDSWAEPLSTEALEAQEPLATSETPALDGCNRLPFEPSIAVKPDGEAASSPSGLTVDVHNPQEESLNAEGLGEADVKDITVALPVGVQLNPSAADGLQACTQGEVGFTGFAELDPTNEPGVQTPQFTPEVFNPATGKNEVTSCPSSAKIATATVHTPLLSNELKGAVYLASPQNFSVLSGAPKENPFQSLVAMYLIVKDPVSGVIVKLAGSVSLNPIDGQITATFANSPQAPFEDAELHFFGGERAPLATPAHCGTYTTNASFTPWSAPPGGTSSSSTSAQSHFEIDSGPGGSPCASALPFNPSLSSQTTNINAGGFTPLSTTLSRPSGDQNIQSVTLHYPAGLSGLLSGVKLCGEAEANAGTCGPESQIGETIVSVGIGGEPFTVTGGKVYITGPYEGAPFGLSIANPAAAGPFDLQEGRPVVVRAKIEVNPTTAALTITTNSGEQPNHIPTIIEGFPLQIQHVNVLINRPGFTFNPTNCNPTKITGTINSAEGASSPVEVPFQVTNCTALKFTPKFAVSTSGKTSKSLGASLTATVSEPAGSMGTQANIAKVKVELPKQLPSRLTTLQKACTAAQFESNPAGCPSESDIGHAKVITPLVPVPLEGPVYFVSHGGEAFPSLEIVLQGYGVKIVLVGTTFISKSGITSTTFKVVPDQPFNSFSLTLPEGKFSALAANGNLCSEQSALKMPTEFVSQAGGEPLKQNTTIAVTGCKPAITVVSHSVKGHTATLQVSVPSAGRLTASGKGLIAPSGASKATKSTSSATGATLTVKLTLSKAEQAFLKKHHARRLKAKIKLTFTPKKGGKLRTSTTVFIG